MLRVVVIDGMGGGIGSQVISQLRGVLEPNAQLEILALGTNSAATTNMVKAGADKGATGENAICFCVRGADIIIGPLGIIIPNGMLGEITPAIATAIVASSATKFLLPINQPHVVLVGVNEAPLTVLLRDLVKRVQKELDGR